MFDCFVFFFKQKTAYEIYQCDWSSDVCSSDLNQRLQLDRVFFNVVRGPAQLRRAKQINGTYHGLEIGRASCRERV